MEVKAPHPFHAFIREKVEEITREMIEGIPRTKLEDVLIIGADCRYDYREDLHVLPLYYTMPQAGRDAREYQYCWPDMLVCPKGNITGIIEIEEQNGKTAVTLFGKFMAACAAKYYIPSGTKPKQRYTIRKQLDESCVFIHIVESRRNSEKLDAVRCTIKNNIAPKLGGRITDYELLYGQELDFEEGGRLRAGLCKALGSMFG